MKQTINCGEFMQAFHRLDRYNQFGYQALTKLFEYFEECNPDMELDVIAVCCEYSHDSVEDIAENYYIDLTYCADDEEKAKTVRDWLNEHTTLIGETDNGFVYCPAF